MDMKKVLRILLSLAGYTLKTMSEVRVCPKCNQTFRCRDPKRKYCVRCSKHTKTIDDYQELDWTKRKRKKKK